MRVSFRAAAFLFFLMATPALAHVGGRDGAGGDIPSLDRGAAWFLEERSIRYCHTGDLGHGAAFDAGGTEKILDEAFKAWKSYLAQKEIYRTPLAVRQRMRIILNHELMPDGCDGTEDLKFYLGTQNDAVAAAKREYDNPVAFAKRTTVGNGWSRGFIWIAAEASLGNGVPTWRVPNLLTAAVLHELGHVVGCDHVAGTIMRGTIARDFQILSRAPERWAETPLMRLRLTRIDNERELVVNRHVEKSAIGRITDRFDPDGAAKEREVFSRFTGRAPVGQISASVRLQGRTATLRWTDAKGVESVTIDVSEEGMLHFDGPPVFRVNLVPHDASYLSSKGMVLNGKTRDPAAREYLVQIVRNSFTDGGPGRGLGGSSAEGIRIFFVDGATRKQMFHETPEAIFAR